MGADDMVTNNHDIAVIEYHNGDPYATADDAIRETYNGVGGFPHSTVDGILGFSGGNATTSLYPSYLSLYEERIVVPSVHLSSLDVVQTGATTYEATVNLEQIHGYFADGLVLRAALTESHIPESWGSGLTEVNFVQRQMFPDANGTTLDFSGSSTHTEVFTFDIAGYVKDNCELVIFVQHDPSKEVVQASKLDLETVVGIEDIEETKFAVYPNPADNYTNVFSDGNGKIEIYNISGQLVYSTNIDSNTQRIDVSELNNGVYIVKVISETKTYTDKLIVE